MSQGKNAVSLCQQGNGNQQNNQGIGNNGLGLKGKQQHHRQNQTHNGKRFQAA
ncbi:hypothetical protein MY928_04145 [Haemophilus influenzae]|uniref:Uncharacterized protein n=1 Tax=Haemophilus influenzae R3021 TaxID=375432 RepID=A4N4R9_HAEIF|nr:hypothetical protein CGSHi22421_00110 [Haemophilus influenzae R3021]MCK9033471.1 hypothetical protein [Haemophilus influenzae]